MDHCGVILSRCCRQGRRLPARACSNGLYRLSSTANAFISTSQHASAQETSINFIHAPEVTLDEGAWLVAEGKSELQRLVDSRDARLRLLRRIGTPAYTNHSVSLVTSPVGHSDKGPWGIDAQPLTLAAFRKNLHHPRILARKRCHTLLAAQLLHCTTTKEMLRVLVIVMAHPRSEVASILSRMEMAITRAWYRCRAKDSDRLVLRSILQFIRRFQTAGLAVGVQHYRLAVKFAARSRDPETMRRCLSLYRQHSDQMPDYTFRAIVAKLSVGRRKLGTIRNGSWHEGHLRQVLLGFDAEAHLPENERCHLGTFVYRSNWAFLHGWIAALGLAKATDKLWDEWQLWKHDPDRVEPKKPRATYPSTSNADPNWNTRLRGDTLFIEVMQLAEDDRLAWRIALESGTPFSKLKQWVLLDLIKDAYLAADRSIELQTLLISRFGSQVLSSGQTLQSLCVLDAVDAAGNAVISTVNATMIYQHLKGIIGWKALPMPGGHTAVQSQEHGLLAADADDLVDEEMENSVSLS